LKNASATDQCLSCHAAYGQFAGGTGYGAGGDFYWVTATFSWDAHGSTVYSLGDSHGHNVVAPAYGISEDLVLTQAPGGDFDAEFLSCTSCHDPHGNQNFRLLYGADDRYGVPEGPIVDGLRTSFDYPAPLAKGNSRRTVSGSGIETNTAHTVYKSGMSNWCANCHPDMHSVLTTTQFVHPTGVAMGTAVAALYNNYISTDDPENGADETSYFGLVPFEAVAVDLETVDSTNYTQGPTSSDRVMCLTCHRAHASAFSDMGRWDFSETFLADSHPADDTEGSAEDVANKYYNYTFVDNQRSLCNKCHVKDAYDEPY
jgi:hypothetical protein